MKDFNYYVADFENNTPRPDIYAEDGSVSDGDLIYSIYQDYCEKSEFEEIEDTFDTRIWAAALGPVMENPNDEDVIVKNSIEGFIQEIQKLPNKSVVYFHNLSYDGPLLLTYLSSLYSIPSISFSVPRYLIV